MKQRENPKQNLKNKREAKLDNVQTNTNSLTSKLSHNLLKTGVQPRHFQRYQRTIFLKTKSKNWSTVHTNLCLQNDRIKCSWLTRKGKNQACRILGSWHSEQSYMYRLTYHTLSCVRTFASFLLLLLLLFSSSSSSLIPCGKFRSPYTAAAKAALPIPTSVCSIFVC